MDADCSVDGTIPNRNDQLFLTRCGFATQTTEEQSASIRGIRVQGVVVPQSGTNQ